MRTSPIYPYYIIGNLNETKKPAIFFAGLILDFADNLFD